MIDSTQAIDVRCSNQHIPVTIAGFLPIEVDGRRMGWANFTRLVPGIPAHVDLQTRPTSDQRWNFKCRRCGYGFPVREDQLWPILDTLDANDVRSITLPALAARLRSS